VLTCAVHTLCPLIVISRRQELAAVQAGRVALVDGNQMFNRPVGWPSLSE
jgi:hypothetical protein